MVEESPARIDTDLYVASQTAMGSWDAEALLAEISAPTLVVGSPTSPWLPPDVPQRIASQIADCRLIFEHVDIRSERIAALAAEHLLGGPAQTSQPRPAASGMTAILYADIADSTALTERMGDAAFRDRSRQLEERLRAVVRECGGVAVEGRTLGDGVLATFGSAREAIEAGLAMVGSGVKGQGSGRDDDALLLHVGIHAGDVLREEGNVYGGAVNIAARISDAARAGEVLVSDVVRGLARTSAGVSFEDRGARALKGIDEEIRVWAVRGE
jgi:class 3 adenylate cyclase